MGTVTVFVRTDLLIYSLFIDLVLLIYMKKQAAKKKPLVEALLPCCYCHYPFNAD